MVNKHAYYINFCWIIQEDWKNKIEIINKNKWITALLGLIFLYILALLWGNNDNTMAISKAVIITTFSYSYIIKNIKKALKKQFFFLSINFLAGCLQIINDNWLRIFFNFKR